MASSSAAQPLFAGALRLLAFWRGPWRLRTALGLLGLSLVVPGLFFFSLQYRAAVVEKQQEIERDGRQYAHFVAADVDRELRVKRAQLGALAASPALRMGDYATFHMQATAALKESPGWISLFRGDGMRLMTTSEPIGAPQNHSHVATYLQRALEIGEPIFTDLFTRSADKSFAVAMIYPVGQSDLLLGGGFLLAHLNDSLRQAVPNGWLAVLLDRNAQVIASSKDGAIAVGKSVDAKAWDAIASAPEGWTVMTSLEGVESWASWVRLSNGWTVLVSVPCETIEQPMRAWERQVLGNLIFFSIVAVAGAVAAGQWIARAMAALTAAAAAIGRGETVSAVTSNLREVNDVGQALSRASQDRERATAAMRESEARFRALLGQNSAGISIASLDGRFMFANRRHCQFTGYSEDEIVTMTVDDITHPDDRAETRRLIEVIVAGAESFTWEKRFVRKDGQVVWGQVNSTVVRDDAGRPLYLLGLVLDINERKRAEMANAHLAAIVASSADAIMSLTLDGRILTWNPAAEQLFGYSAQEAIGQSITLIVPEERRDEIEREILAVKKGEKFRLETVRRRKDGSLVEVSLDSAPIRAAYGAVIAISVIANDITERRRTEAALYEREQQFRTLANSIPQLAWMTNADGWVVWYNDRWYDYTGTTPEQMEGSGWQSVYDPAVLPDIMARWNRSLATGEPFDMVFPLKGADGVFRPFLTRAMPLRDAKGRIARWFGTNTDVTAQMEHEAHLNFVMRELSHRSKNLLAVVQAMARQTMQHSSDFEDFEGRFMGRLHGLARSHDVLVRQDWTGACIRDLVNAQLAPFVREDGASLEISGPDLMLKPDAVQNLGFALFELATNAVKYGALSVPSGKVIIAWALVGDGGQQHLRFNWRESGGPRVNRPKRKGFGAVVIERFMAAAFGGAVNASFAPEGFSWTLEIPADHLLNEIPAKRAIGQRVSVPSR